jgi:L-alanine-DL-glutamate epimerase-like enolase superfamily enzyme
MKVNISVYEARLRAPFVSSRDSVRARPLILLALEAGSGTAGFGEAAPLVGYDGVTIDDVRAALEDCRPLLTASDGGDRAELLAACESAAVLPQATAAVDLALWDLTGRRLREPVWRLLGARDPPPIRVNATIIATDRAGAASEAAAAVAAGFGCVKVKVGIGDDAGRLAAVRAAGGPDLQIRLDANGAWSIPEATATLRALEPTGLELCEEPVAGVDAITELGAQSPVALAIDESAASPGALDRRACTAVCLKISRFGGITGLVAAAGRARRAGYEVYLASTLDGPLGIAAALHAAAVIGPDRPNGLATLSQIADRDDPLPAVHGHISVPSGPGLGDGLASWYRGP